MRKDFIRRNSLSYKIKMWFYHLTINDFIKCGKIMSSCIIEFIMCALIFGLIFIIPALLH